MAGSNRSRSGSGRGSGGSAQPVGTRAANQAVNQRLKSAGLTGIGSKLFNRNASLFQGKRSSQVNHATLWNNKEGNQRRGALGEAGAQWSKAQPRSTVKRRKG